MNQVQLIGRITKEPELRHTGSGKPVVTFVLAVNDRFRKDSANFISCVAWNNVAELMKAYVHKGNKLGIVGHIATRTYEKDGSTRNVTEVIVEELDFLEPKEHTVAAPIEAPVPTFEPMETEKALAELEKKLKNSESGFLPLDLNEEDGLPF